MSIAYVTPNGSSFGTAGGGFSVSVAAPSGAVSGDLLLAYCTSEYASSITAPGWTQIGTGILSGSSYQFWTQVFYIQYAGTGSPWTFTSNSTELDVEIRAYSGVATSSPIDDFAFGNTDLGTSLTIPGLTATANANEVEVVFIMDFGADVTYPGALGNTYDQTGKATTWAGDRSFASSGATVGSLTATSGTAGAYTCIALTLIPAASGPSVSGTGADTGNVSEIATAIWGISATGADAGNLAETDIATGKAVSSGSDSASGSETASAYGASNATASDTGLVSESASATTQSPGNLSVSASDAGLLTESASDSISGSVSANDAGNLSETVSGHAAITESGADSSLASETASAKGSVAGGASDAAGVIEQAASQVTAQASAAELAVVSESASAITQDPGHLSVSAADTVTISEQAVATARLILPPQQITFVFRGASSPVTMSLQAESPVRFTLRR